MNDTALLHDELARLAADRRQRWRDRAACAGLPTDWWVPGGERLNRHWPAFTRQALDVCAACPVRVPCRRWADATHRRQPLDGVFAGRPYGRRVRRMFSRRGVAA